jgi:outer membrane protein OmpA-like peptidoglycan-associated protein
MQQPMPEAPMPSLSARADDPSLVIATQSMARNTRRLVLRSHSVLLPFVWRGLLPLLGLLLVLLYALWPFARGTIEATVTRETRLALDQAGFGWVTLSVSGQQLRLSGAQPQAGAGDQALAVARTATCPTWLGLRSCATEVSGSFSDPVAVPAPAASPPAPQAARACEAELSRLLADAQIRFETGRADIRADSAQLLDQLAQAARQCPGSLRIEGHTDGIGAAAANQALSEARAQAVRAALIARGLPAERLLAQGYGASRPLAANQTAAGRAANRRIEFRALADR